MRRRRTCDDYLDRARSSGRQDVLITGEAVERLESGQDLNARAAYKTAERRGVRQKKEDGAPKRSGGKASGGGQTLDGFNRRTGLRDRRYV